MAKGRLKLVWRCGVSAAALSWGSQGLPVMAADFTVPAGTTETTPQTLTSGEIGIVENGGALTTMGGADSITAIDNNTIINDGAVSASGAFADGIVVGDGNTIDNNGSIDVDGGFNFGIDAGDNNIIRSSGSITATDLSVGLIADSNNTIDVSGTISTLADNSPAIVLNDDNIVTISGALTTQGNGAAGLLPDSRNTIEISGSINTQGNASDGIFTNSDNTIDVSGSISTVGVASFGINALDNNIIDVSGTITTTGDFSNGIDVLDDNTVDVSGTISTTGIDADGIIGDNNNTISLSGMIGTTGEDGDGIDVNDFNHVNNSGLIKTTGSGSADAIEVDDDNIIINSGTLFANGGPFANGVDGESRNQIFNLGDIWSVQGAGIDLTSGASGSTVSNSGVIRGNGVSIDFGPGNDRLVVANGSVLDGLVDFDAGTSSIFFETGNQTITTSGTTPTIGSAADVFFVQNGNTVTSLDQDLLGLSELNDAFLDQSHRIHRVISNQIGTDAYSQVAARSREVQVASNDDNVYGHDQNDKSVWATVYGGFADRNDDGPIPDSRHNFWGALAGARLIDHEGASLGVFGGYGSSQIDSNHVRTSAEVDRFFGGLYSAFPMGQWGMTTNVFGGVAQTDSVRNITNNTSPGGVDAARAEIDSFFVGAGFETARVFKETVGAFGLRPAGGLRYAGEWSDGYTETGALAALTVGDRTSHAVTGFAELALVVMHSQIQISLGLGAEGRAQFGDDSVNVTLLATPFTVTPEDNDTTVDGYARLGVRGTVTERLSLFLDLEGRTGSDVDVGAAAQTGLNLQF